ncbi:MAG TPA: tetratricopeptide repeat protein [Vicinamibacterales bacterium]|nr:tetratricopeptide repeat protein [Vicinamibacterales bacterium]
MADNTRLDDLRRRVLADPASIAFAQLAEECRRAGDHQEAVEICRAGLAIHPAYASARVTLGRALIELDRLDDAETELSLVFESVPDNLAAIRGLAVIHRRRGDLDQALSYYRHALELAPRDPDLERTVEVLSRQIEARAVEAASAPSPARLGQAADAKGDAIEVRQLTGPATATPTGGTLSPATDDRGSRTLAALEQWLVAVHVARARRRS